MQIIGGLIPIHPFEHGSWQKSQPTEFGAAPLAQKIILPIGELSSVIDL